MIFTENQALAKPLYDNMAALLFLLKNSLSYDIIHMEIYRAKLLDNRIGLEKCLFKTRNFDIFKWNDVHLDIFIKQ